MKNVLFIDIMNKINNIIQNKGNISYTNFLSYSKNY